MRHAYSFLLESLQVFLFGIVCLLLFALCFSLCFIQKRDANKLVTPVSESLNMAAALKCHFLSCLFNEKVLRAEFSQIKRFQHEQLVSGKLRNSQI